MIIMREFNNDELLKQLLITQTNSDFTLNNTLKLFIKVKLCKDILLGKHTNTMIASSQK